MHKCCSTQVALQFETNPKWDTLIVLQNSPQLIPHNNTLSDKLMQSLLISKIAQHFLRTSLTAGTTHAQSTVNMVN